MRHNLFCVRVIQVSKIHADVLYTTETGKVSEGVCTYIFSVYKTVPAHLKSHHRSVVLYLAADGAATESRNVTVAERLVW